MNSVLKPVIARMLMLLLFGLGLVSLPTVAASADEFLDPSEAFKLQVTRSDDVIRLRWTIAPGYHLYAERIELKATDPKVQIAPLVLPKGEEKFDKNFNRTMRQYSGEAVVSASLLQVPAGLGKLDLTIVSQGCADAGLCYPPQSVNASVDAKPVTPSAASVATSVATSEPDSIARTLGDGNILNIALMFFGLGLLLSFTPCVLPMIPILSSIILGSNQNQAQGSGRTRGFALSLAYSLGMILVYTSMGIAAGLLGEGLAASMQKPWVLTLFSLLLFGFGLAMFDVFTLQAPARLQNGLINLTQKIPGGKFAGVFAMGGLSALIVGPCVAAPLAGALVYIGKTGNVLIGGIALFFLSFGMSQPLLLTGLSAGKLLPRAGAWMEGVKRFFGLLMFATALWLAQPVLPYEAFVLALVLLLLMGSNWLNAFLPLPANSSLALTAGKAAGLVLAVAAVLQLIGLASGGRDPVRPIKHLVAGGASVTGAPEKAALDFIAVRDLAQLDQLVAKTDKPLVLDFYADWCASCKEMEHGPFADPKIVSLLRKATLVRADVTRNTEQDKLLMKRFGLFGPPALLVLAPSGNEIEKARVVGYKSAEALHAQLSTFIP